MSREYPCGTWPVKWISTDWLSGRLGDENLLLLDVQPNIHDYIQEHIPGAVYMSEGLLRQSDHGIPGAFVSGEAVEPVLRATGIDARITVVVYTGTGAYKGWGDGLEQTMVAYSLVRYGHDHVYILDGGLDKWKGENRPLTKIFPSVKPSRFKARFREGLRITYKEFKDMKDDSDVLLLDARPAAVYEGQGPWIKPGHIPGAVNLPWAGLMDDTNKRLLKPDHEIKAILESHGVGPDKMIICSCGTGREATNEFLLFKFCLDFPRVMIYEGSFTEWTSYPENPTVTGKSPV